MQDGTPVPDPVCGRCNKVIERARRTEAVYQDGVWLHPACHRDGVDQHLQATGLTAVLQSAAPPGVQADEGQAMSTSPSQRWVPSTGEQYWLMLGDGRIERFPWNDTAFDHEAWRFGNCFKTYEEAVHAREKISEVLRILHEDHASPDIVSP
jgi:hypothetical protein